MNVIGHDVVVVGKSLPANGAPSVLPNNLAIQQLPHLRSGTELTEPSGVMRIFDALHPELFETAFLENHFPAAAIERAVNGTVLVTTKFH
jgi:hypothetical protein